MANISDLKDGKSIFEESLGPKNGGRLWVPVFLVLVVAVVSGALLDIGVSWKGIIALATPASVQAQTVPSACPPGAAICDQYGTNNTNQDNYIHDAGHCIVTDHETNNKSSDNICENIK